MPTRFVQTTDTNLVYSQMDYQRHLYMRIWMDFEYATTLGMLHYLRS